MLTRCRSRSGLSDMAAAYQGLGYLESGITEPLNRFAEKMLDFSDLLKHMVRDRRLRDETGFTHSQRIMQPSNLSYSPRIRSWRTCKPPASNQAPRPEAARLRGAIRLPVGHRVRAGPARGAVEWALECACRSHDVSSRPGGQIARYRRHPHPERANAQDGRKNQRSLFAPAAERD